MTTPSPESRALAQQLHDEMRADIPTFKIMGKSLLPDPWSPDRIDGIANLVDAAIDARINTLLDVALERAGLGPKKGRRAA